MTMPGKQAVIISCSDHYGHRMFAIDAALRRKGYETTYITSDFDHTQKRVYRCPVEGCVQLHAIPYKRNLSVSRLVSHMLFARDAFHYVERMNPRPDVVVAVVPPNFQVHFGAKYKKKHPETRVIFDIFDLWPETFPSGKAKKLLSPFFAVWAWIRDRHLSGGDFVITECRMFREKLGLSEETSQAVYLCAVDAPQIPAQLPEGRLNLCYLGAINNVAGIDAICQLLRDLTRKKPVCLHIIGKGERQEELIRGAEAAGAEVVFHGAVFDEEKKQQIMANCHFGLNIMKTSVCVGLTMKSVDYLRYGLPIINNIPADTQELVKERGIGVQLEDGCAERIAAMTKKDHECLRRNALQVFRECFSRTVIDEQYDRLLERIL